LDMDTTGRFGNFVDVDLVDGRFIGFGRGLPYIEGKQIENSRAEIRAGNNLTVTAAGKFVNSAEIRAGGDITVSASEVANQAHRFGDGGFETGNPISETTNAQINYNKSEDKTYPYIYPDEYERNTVTETWEEHEWITDGVPAVKPIMVAQGGFDLTATGDIKNYGGLLQGGANSLLTAGGGIENNALITEKEKFTQVSVFETKFIALGGLTYYRDKVLSGGSASGGTFENTNDGFAVAKVIGGGNLSITGGGTLTNTGDLTPNSSSRSAAGQAAENPSGFSLNISLPDSPNGFFVTNRDPSAAYLVEMNPKLQPGVSTLGSEYLLENLNIDTDSTFRRLGDSGYEAYLVEQQLIQQTGAGVLDGYGNIADVMSGFMENSVSQAGTLGLTFGQPLTQEQLGALQEPIIWMVEVEIDGETVLAPQVYLPRRIQDEIAQQ